jgi:pimeloyl-ACP methyl ester carboxylesterase
VVTFDKRGQGLSDKISGAPSLEERMDDVRAIMDDIGSRRAVLFGFSEGCPMSILFAATYPERVSHLVLYGGFARAGDLWPPGLTPDALEARVPDELLPMAICLFDRVQPERDDRFRLRSDPSQGVK